MQVCAWTYKTPLRSVGATARRRAGATARRHHPSPAEAHRRWRGERSKPVRLGVRDHHTRSLCAESPAQTEQWCCCFAAGGSSSERKRSRPIRAFSATPHDGQRPCRTLAEDPGRTQPRAAYPRRCSSNATGLHGRNSAPRELGWCRPRKHPWLRSWPTPELRIPNAAAQTRIVSKARIRLDSGKSVRSFKGIICVDISEFESYMPSHAVGLSASLLVSAGGGREAKLKADHPHRALAARHQPSADFKMRKYLPCVRLYVSLLPRTGGMTPP